MKTVRKIATGCFVLTMFGSWAYFFVDLIVNYRVLRIAGDLDRAFYAGNGWVLLLALVACMGGFVCSKGKSDEQG